MNNYWCKHGLVHDKPCEQDEPSSANGWIYTAYYNAKNNRKIQKSITETTQLKRILKKLEHPDRSVGFMHSRLPYSSNEQKPYAPMSRDEIIGMYSLLGWIAENEIQVYQNDYYFDKSFRIKMPLKKHIEAFKALWASREDRNYFWKKNIFPAYKYTFKLWPHDQYWLKKRLGFKPRLHQVILWHLYVVTTILQGTKTKTKLSASNVLWLQLVTLNSKFYRWFIDIDAQFWDYFPEDHPLNK